MRQAVVPNGRAHSGGAAGTMAASGRHWSLERHTCIPIYWPNIVGYVRIVCTTTAIAIAFTFPRAMLVFYFIR